MNYGMFYTDKEINDLTALPDASGNSFFNRRSPNISIDQRLCASPQKVAYSFGSDKPSILGNDSSLNIRTSPSVEIAKTRSILSNHLSNLPTLQQILFQLSINAEIIKVCRQETDSESELDSPQYDENDDMCSSNLSF